MKKSYMYFGLGVLAVGVAYYFYNKSKNPKTKPMATTKPDEKLMATKMATDEPKSNYSAGNLGRKQCTDAGGTITYLNGGGWVCNISK